MTPPIVRTLPLPGGFDPATQHAVGFALASLDRQLDDLKERTRDLSIRHLEWQLNPGMNTTGVLMAHIAVAEFYWINVAPYGIDPDKEGDRMIYDALGIRWDDDGLPMAHNARHPQTLANRTAEDYFHLLDAARAHTRARLLTWTDAGLETTYTRGTRTISLGWTLYHVLEHMSQHIGQVGLLRHLMVDAGMISRHPD